MSERQLRDDALTIWHAGVDAVDSDALVQRSCSFDDDQERLLFLDQQIPLSSINQICVVGAGKAGAGMAEGLEKVLLPRFAGRLSGWVNVPEDCVRSLDAIHLHGARPAGVNEPTRAGVEGTQQILKRIEQLNNDDLCIVLISGGGSALLPCPVSGITMAEKQQVTRTLSRAGATIEELNSVRRAISDVKGGGLLRRCQAGRMITLVISDVIGDPLETIASGPTVDMPAKPDQALAVLKKFEAAAEVEFPESIWNELQRQISHQTSATPAPSCKVTHLIIGNNKTAVNAAVKRAEDMGYQILKSEADQPGQADKTGFQLAIECLAQHRNAPPGTRLAIISGGEPTVQLVKTEAAQKGGRNQELVLAAARSLQSEACEGIAILSGGTDGEDGPTDAAGAFVDCEVLKNGERLGLSIDDYLSVNNSYPYFQQTGGLIRTGPTHTNVMDLRVALIER